MTENTSSKKFVIYDGDGFVVGHSNTVLGCYRQLADASIPAVSWQTIKKNARVAGVIQSVLVNDVQYEIAPRDDAEYVDSHLDLI